jgi:ribose 5-phosphate isomerase B
MKIFIGTDHAGFGLKEILVPYLQNQGHVVVDKGAHKYDENDDYPDFIIPVAEEVSKDRDARGIIFGGTGEGEAIVANKFPHVRAAVYYGKSDCVVDDDADIILRSREHNDANMLSLGARYLTEESMLNVVNTWLNTPFPGDERHVRRLAKIDKIHSGK